MADWSSFTLATLLKSLFPGILHDRTVNLGKMDFASDTNLPDEFVRLNRDMHQLEEKSGSNWLPAVRPLMLPTDRTTTSDSFVAIPDFDSVYALKSGVSYRYHGLVHYSAFASGFDLRLSNIASGSSTYGVAKFYNFGGTKVESIFFGESPSWSCAASNVFSEGVLELDGVITANADFTLGVQFKRETASGTLALRDGSMLEFKRIT